MDVIWQWGINLILTLQQHSPGLDLGMKFLSFLGGEEFFMLLIPFLYWCVDTTRGLRVLALLLFSDFTNGLLKWAFHAPRPYWVDARVKALAAETSYGLPSGHAQVATAIWGFLARAARRPLAWVAAVLLVLGISISRVYLGVHFPHDVAAGWVAGALVLAAYLWLEPRAATWLKPRPLAVHVAAVLLLSAGMLAAVFGVSAAIAGTIDPPAWEAQAAAAGPPDAGRRATDPRSMDGFFTNLGVAFGAGIGLALRRRYVSFDPRGPWVQRILRLGLGLVVLLGLRSGLGALFPREPLEVALLFRYVRYALIGLWTVWLALWAFVRLGLAGPE
ncbi:MAG: phosphatase PAP2 family protein [bacterium]|nr:phosphatase PAP2 family protein [bacterium]